MANWTAVTTDTFIRANSGPDVTPGNTDAVGNSWVDVAGTYAAIVSNQLVVTPPTNASPSEIVSRPTNETAMNSRIVVQYIAQNPLGSRFATFLRSNSALNPTNTAYLFTGNAASGLSLIAEPQVNSGAALPSSGTNSITIALPTSGHTMQLDSWAFTNTVGPTFLQAQLIDITTSTTIATTAPAWDTNASLQGSGQQAVGGWRQTGGGTPIAITSAITYTGNPDAVGLYLMGPTTGSVSVPATFTVVPGGGFLTNTVTVASSNGGDTISSSQTPTSGSTTPLTFTVTPVSTGARTISITNTGGLTNFNTITFTAGSSSISISPTTLPGDAVATVTVTGSGTTFTGSPFTLTTGIGHNIGGLLISQTVNSTTSATLSLDPGIYGLGNATITDTGGGASATLTVTPPLYGSINMGFIGDSITASSSPQATATFGNCTDAVHANLVILGYTNSIYVNAGIGGASSDQWVPSSAAGRLSGNYNLSVNGTTSNVPITTTYFARAMTAFSGAGLSSGDVIHIMLGTNDVRGMTTANGADPQTRSALTVSQHFNNMKSIVTGCVSAGYKVVLTHPLYTVPYANNTLEGSPAPNNADMWPGNCNATYQSYWQADMALIDNVNVFIGDTTGFYTSQTGPNTFLAVDGIHPANTANYQVLGKIWANSIVNRFGVTSGGTAPTATQVTIAAQSTCLVSVAQTLTFFLDAGAPTGGVAITPAIVSGGGSLSAMSGTISAGSTGPVTCTYTPSTAGAKVISFTNSATLTNTGSPFTITASASGGSSGGGVIIG